jgi:4-hydroxybenzoate polyprenyltransferase
MSHPAALDYERPGHAESTSAVPAQTGTIVSILRGVTTLGVAIWFGSLVHLLLTVSSLFAAFPKAISSVAVQGAPAIFRASEIVGLVVAAVTLASAVIWSRVAPGRSRKWLAWLLAAAAALAVAQRTIVSAKMDSLRDSGQSGGDAFRALHGVSSSQYLVQTGLLLAATLTLPAALSRK